MMDDTNTDETLFQLNHVRLMKPGAGESVSTNDGNRLFVPVEVIDYTGSISLRMREAAALTVSGEKSAADFKTQAKDSLLTYPMLCNIRVLVRPAERGSTDQGELRKSAVVVEAGGQTWAPPSKAALDLHALLKAVPSSQDKLVAARLGDIERSPHSGLTVAGGKVPCRCALALVATSTRSKGQKTGTGFRVVTRDVVDCDPWKDDGLGDCAFAGMLASICSIDAIPQVTLSPMRPGETVYALVLVSNVTPDTAATAQPGSRVMMVEQVYQVVSEAVPDVRRMLRKLSQLARKLPRDESSGSSPMKLQSPQWPSADETPWTARKARKLHETPTDASIPDSEVDMTPATKDVDVDGADAVLPAA